MEQRTEIAELLAQYLISFTKQQRVSSTHINFMRFTDIPPFEKYGYLLRQTVQYRWGWFTINSILLLTWWIDGPIRIGWTTTSRFSLLMTTFKASKANDECRLNESARLFIQKRSYKIKNHDVIIWFTFRKWKSRLFMVMRLLRNFFRLCFACTPPPWIGNGVSNISAQSSFKWFIR